jgi:hypothetical protein
MNDTIPEPKGPASRVDQTSSHVTPSMWLMTWIWTGGTPISMSLSPPAMSTAVGTDRKAELLDGRQEARTVLRGGPDEDVEIAREARSAVERERVRADNNEINRASGQQRARTRRSLAPDPTNCLRRNSTAATRSAGGRLRQCCSDGFARASSVKVVIFTVRRSLRKSTRPFYRSRPTAHRPQPRDRPEGRCHIRPPALRSRLSPSALSLSP